MKGIADKCQPGFSNVREYKLSNGLNADVRLLRSETHFL